MPKPDITVTVTPMDIINLVAALVKVASDLSDMAQQIKGEEQIPTFEQLTQEYLAMKEKIG